MDVRDLDRSIEKRAALALRLAWSNIVLFVTLAVVAFAGLMVGLLALQPRYEGTALVIAGRNSVDEPSSQGPSQRSAETGGFLARVAESDEVVRSAIQRFGMERLAKEEPKGRPSPFLTLRHLVLGAPREVTPSLSLVDRALTRVKSQLAVRAEPSSDVLRITFRDADPTVAAEFADAVTRAFLDRYAELYTRQGVPEFFSRQKQRFEDEFTAASRKLEQFGRDTQTYSADEQRKLLLQRRNDLLSSVAVSRGLMAQKRGELQALSEQLRKLAPVTQSPYLSSLVDDLDREPGSQRALPRRGPADASGTPPLLMIKVYQDSMVTLFRINAELLGAENLERQQVVEADALTEELNKLGTREREFMSLKRAVDQAATNSDQYARRLVEEQISAEAYASKISPLRILQSASIATRPIFPNYVLGTVSAFVLALLLSFLSILFLRRDRLADGWVPARPETLSSVGRS